MGDKIALDSASASWREKILNGAWKKDAEGGFFLRVHVQPNARRAEICDEPFNGALKVKLSAIPEDGKANEALRLLIAETLDIARSRVTIERGHASREKWVFVKTE